jgi:hypothetical protein
MWRLITASIVAAVALAGCGGGGGSSTGTGPLTSATPAPATAAPALSADALLDHLPGGVTEIAVMDLAAARRQLGIAADTDPADYRIDDNPGRRRFDDAALKPLGYLTRPTKAIRAIDYGRVTAVISARRSFEETVLILATTQPRAEIERGLSAAGRRPIADDAYALQKPDTGFEGAKVLVFGDGLVVLGSSLGVARGVLRRTVRDKRLAPTRALLDSVRGAFRAVPVGSLTPDAPCVDAIAGGQRFEAHGDDDLVLRLTEPAAAGRVVLDKGAQRTDDLTADYSVRHVTVKGQTLALRVDLTPDAIANSSAASIAYGEVQPEQVYDCRGTTAKPAAPGSSSDPELLPLPAPIKPDASGTRFETAGLGVHRGRLAGTERRARALREGADGPRPALHGHAPASRRDLPLHDRRAPQGQRPHQVAEHRFRRRQDEDDRVGRVRAPGRARRPRTARR